MSRRVRRSTAFDFTIAISILLAVAAAAETTNGPLAAVSIWSDIAWSTAKRCAADCIAYDGVFRCGVNAGYYDLGIELGCGCASINGCYCNTGLANSASAYLSTCISGGCAENDPGWTTDLNSMIGLYDAYCLTANVAASTTAATTMSDATAATTNTDETNATGTGASTPGSRASTTASQTATSSQPTSADSQKSPDDGLSRSDIVALAASLGVGIPSLLIAAITLCVQLRKRKKREPRGESIQQPHRQDSRDYYIHRHELKA